MNLLFWALLLALLLVALVIVILPLLKVRPAGSNSTLAYRDSNLDLYDDKLRELESDLKEGRISRDDYDVARAEIDRELLHDIPEESRENASLHYGMSVQRRPGLAMAISVLLPMFALLTYMQLGMHAGAGNQASTPAQAQQGSVPSIEEMTASLAQRLQQQGGTVEEWAMLGRAYKHTGNFQSSSKAFAEALKQQPDNAQLMLERAEAMALGNNQTFDDAALKLVLRAAELEPDNLNVLWFAGVAQVQAGNLREGIDYLARLARQPGLDAEVAGSVRTYIDQARAQLVARGETVSPMEELMPASKPAVAAGFDVNVSIADTVAERFAPGDAVFVYAKAKQGPPMPLAVQRMTLAELPATVRLDDSMAMMEGMNLSTFGSVIVSARVTKSGSAMARKGDYIGEAVVEDVKQTETTDVRIERVVE